MKIRTLKIHRHESVVPGTELRLDAHVNLLHGESGTGKTALLGLLAAIAGTDFSRLEGEAFDMVYEIGDGVFTAIVAIASEGHPQRSPIDGLPEPTAYTYKIGLHRVDGGAICEIFGDPEAMTVRVSGGEPRRLPPSAPFRRGFLTRALREPPAAALFFGAWHLFNWHGTAARFDESLDCFLAMTGRRPALAGVALPRPAEAVFSFDPRASLRGGSLYSVDHYLPGGAIGRAIFDAHRSPAGETHVVAADDEPGAAQDSLVFLGRAARLLGFRGASFHPEVTSYRHERATGTRHYAVHGFTFRFTRDDETSIHHDQLSYGQKRLLALFYYLAASEHFMFADDPFHGLDPAWIPACMQAIGRRQCFLTAPDPRALAYLGFDSLDRVTQRSIVCEAEHGLFRWRNIDAAAAAAVFRSHAREVTARLTSSPPTDPAPHLDEAR